MLNLKVKRLRFYCIVREEIFISTRIYIHKLASLEKKRIVLEKDFNNMLSKWNKKKEEMVSPHLESACR